MVYRTEIQQHVIHEMTKEIKIGLINLGWLDDVDAKLLVRRIKELQAEIVRLKQLPPGARQ